MTVLLDNDPIARLAGARVLFLNWRDSAHPQAGGAEVYCWEIARRFAAGGMEVTLLTSRPSGAPAHAVVDGVEIDRRGGTYSLYTHAAAFLARNRRRFDVVVDCQNGIPFFSPVFVHRTASVVCVIHHVHQDQFGVHFGWPLRVLGRELEGRWSRLVYGQRPIAAVSPSTRTAVREVLGLRGPIFVVPNGVSQEQGPSAPRRRSPIPLIACVGRLALHKRMDLLVRAAGALRARFPALQIEIAGDGPDRVRLERLASALGVDSVVRFLGHVSDETKRALLASAWLTVNPSIGEGWGLGILEANAHGVPALAYRVRGLRDSIRDGATGWLLEPHTDLSAAIATALGILSDPVEADAWAERCRVWAATFSWDESTRRLARVIAAERAHRAYRGPIERRTVRDAACLASFPVADPERFPALAARRLRVTDLWALDRDQATVLLHGADEAAVRMVLRRLEPVAPDNVVVVGASDDHLLAGPMPVASTSVAPT
jgi:glycosyltransferase involved in cell wall biosynthesis